MSQVGKLQYCDQGPLYFLVTLALKHAQSRDNGKFHFPLHLKIWQLPPAPNNFSWTKNKMLY